MAKSAPATGSGGAGAGSNFHKQYTRRYAEAVDNYGHQSADEIEGAARHGLDVKTPNQAGREAQRDLRGQARDDRAKAGSSGQRGMRR